MDEEKMRVYGTIGSFRLVNIKVVVDENNVLYEGAVDNAPGEIRNLKYSKVKTGKEMEFYVYSKFQ